MPGVRLQAVSDIWSATVREPAARHGEFIAGTKSFLVSFAGHAGRGGAGPVRQGWPCLHVAGLRLQTYATWDLPIMLAARSDPQAQRRLGWRPRDLVPERRRERLLAGKPGQGRTLSRPGYWRDWRLPGT
jgi:hypothetical protein